MNKKDVMIVTGAGRFLWRLQDESAMERKSLWVIKI